MLLASSAVDTPTKPQLKEVGGFFFHGMHFHPGTMHAMAVCTIICKVYDTYCYVLRTHGHESSPAAARQNRRAISGDVAVAAEPNTGDDVDLGLARKQKVDSAIPVL